MTRRNRPHRLRRTVDPAPAPPTAPSFRRALFGLSAAKVQRLLRQMEQAHHTALGEAKRQVVLEQEEWHRLQAEIDLMKRQLKNSRHIVEVMRDKLARERAAKAVLAARVMDQQAEFEREVQAASQMETVRMGAELEREHEVIRQLVAALYRSIAGRDGVPTGLEATANLIIEAAVAEKEAAPPLPGPPDRSLPWHQLLMGKRLGRELRTPDGRLLAPEGESVDLELIQAAQEAGLLFDLVLHLKELKYLPEL